MNRKNKKRELSLKQLKIEENKLQVEKDKLIITAFLEEFKARRQEFLSLANENNRWQTLYVTAWILVIGWVINISKDYENLRDIFDKGNNSIFILALACVNAIYTFAIARRGYQIEEIGLYLYTKTARKINEILKVSNANSEIRSDAENTFNSWERWRRRNEGGPKWVRLLFYLVVNVLPSSVSFAILYLYWFYKFFDKRLEKLTCFSGECYDVPNLFFILTLIFVLFCFISSLLSTILMTYKWTKVMDNAK